MVSSEELPLRSGAVVVDHGKRTKLRWAFVAAAAAATIVGFVMLSSQGSPDVLFSTNHKLNPQEKQFVKRAVSTPNRDLHRAAQLKSEDGLHDMDTFYDSMGKKLKSQDKTAHKHIQQLKMKADTKAAKRDIDNYFDRMKQAVETMNAEEHKKQAGTGKAALESINSYFDSLSAKEANVNKKDELKLSGVKHVEHHTAAPANPLALVQGVKHGEDTKAAANDINSYFDSLDAAQKNINDRDRAHLRGHYAQKPGSKMTAQESLADLNSYFDQITAVARPNDVNDVNRLRKDDSPANAGQGVRAAMEKKQQLKAYANQKLASMQQKKAAAAKKQ